MIIRVYLLQVLVEMKSYLAELVKLKEAFLF